MNKKVLVTGGARGLGREIARTFAKDGYDVIITYLNSEEAAQDLQNELMVEYHVQVEIFKVDLENDEDISKLLVGIDRLDVLVNNAAYNDDEDVFAKTGDDFLKVLRVNLVAPFILSQKFYSMLKANNGSIINIASTNGIDTMYIESIDYDASKAGLINLTKNLANAFAPDIRVNAVAPGWIETEKLEDMNPLFRGSEENKTMMKRFAKPEEVANVVKFLASSEASYMTGSVVRVDGGNK